MTSMIILQGFVFLKYSLTVQQRLAKNSKLSCSALSSQLLGLSVFTPQLHSWTICTEYLGKILMRVSRLLTCDMMGSIIVFSRIHRYFQVPMSCRMKAPVSEKEVGSSQLVLWDDDYCDCNIRKILHKERESHMNTCRAVVAKIVTKILETRLDYSSFDSVLSIQEALGSIPSNTWTEHGDIPLSPYHSGSRDRRIKGSKFSLMT